MKLYILTGESSGDIHAANLVRELKLYNSSVKIRAWGGERLIAEGVDLAKNITSAAFMGIWDVIKNLNTIRKNLIYCKRDILEYKPDAIILVDYPGFNLKIAKFAKENDIKVFYYIPPKVWAWNKSRAYKMKSYVDELLVIFPFEVDFYEKIGMKATYVGNPLLDEISKSDLSFNSQNEKPIIALLPGSRRQEIDLILPEMLKVIPEFPDYQFVVAGVSSFGERYYQNFIKENNVAVVFNQTYGLIKNSQAAVVTSGTASLEVALFRLPQVVCYKTNILTYILARMLIRIRFISLVNILMDRQVVPELIQADCNMENIKNKLQTVLNRKSDMLIDYDRLVKLLDKEGASKNAAQFIMQSI